MYPFWGPLMLQNLLFWEHVACYLPDSFVTSFWITFWHHVGWLSFLVLFSYLRGCTNPMKSMTVVHFYWFSPSRNLICQSLFGVIVGIVFLYSLLSRFGFPFETIPASFWNPAGSFCLTCGGSFFYRFSEPCFNDFCPVLGSQNLCKIEPITNLDHTFFNDCSTL